MFLEMIDKYDNNCLITNTNTGFLFIKQILTRELFKVREKGSSREKKSGDDAKKRRNEIINIVALSLTVAVLGYVFFLYVIVHYIGVFLNLWT